MADHCGGTLPWSTAAKKVFVRTDMNGEQITKDNMDNNRHRCLVIEEGDMLAQRHLQWHLSILLCFYLFVWANVLRNFKKKELFECQI